MIIVIKIRLKPVKQIIQKDKQK